MNDIPHAIFINRYSVRPLSCGKEPILRPLLQLLRCAALIRTGGDERQLLHNRKKQETLIGTS
jgi:hypothetical protein